ncbi:hypothetical protein BAZOLSSOX_2513 [uncultured Gammaproteobacteria bacterium]|nr:hypothetical protein BAZOLSSOX_2513 [uncultured Gammaproteobacteria bacterium]
MGVDIEITPSVSFELGQENNNTMDATSYGKLTVKLPLGDKQKITNFKIADKVFKASSKVDLGEFAWVERTNKIMIEKENSAGGISAFTGGLFRGLTYALVTSPKTGRVWLDRNLGATQVATKVDDSAAYGDYYQWGRAKDGHQSSTLSGTQTPTQTPSSGIVSGNSKFIYGRADWTTTDSDGALRIAAWNDICPAGFSVPFLADLVLEATSVFTDPSSAASSFLRIPASGFRLGTDPKKFSNTGSEGFLWARTISSQQSRYARNLSIKSGSGFGAGVKAGDYQRTYGMNVRCIRDKI